MAELGVSFEIYNKESVKRLQEENPDILPTYKISESKDLAYNKKQVNAAVTSAIIQGKSIDGIADDLQNKMESLNRNSAIKTARTAITNAQNAGSLSSMKELAAMGVDIQKEWVATLDDRTRPSHRAMDGERRDIDETFSNGLMYPGASGSAKEVWNCRCTMVSYIPDIDTSDAKRWSRDPVTGRREYVPNQTYEQWLESKKTGKNTTAQTSYIKKGVYEDDYSGELNYEYNEKTGALILKNEEGVEIKYDLEKGVAQYLEDGLIVEEYKIDNFEYNDWLKKFKLKNTKITATKYTAKTIPAHRNENRSDLKNWEDEYYKYNSSISFTEKEFPNTHIYTSNAYGKINGYLRGSRKLSGQNKIDMDKLVNGISSEAKKTSLSKDMICWRGVTDIDYITGAGSSYKDAVKAIGKNYTDNAFMSTTVVEGGGFSGAIRLEIEVPKDTKCVYCENFSAYKGAGEYELLLDCGTTFEVTDVVGNDYDFTVKMKVVSQKNK